MAFLRKPLLFEGLEALFLHMACVRRFPSVRDRSEAAHALVRGMSQATALQRLHLYGCGNACMLLAPLSCMPGLEELRISQTRVNDSAVAVLSRGLQHTRRMTHLELELRRNYLSLIHI